MSLTSKIAHNTAYQFGGKIIGTILGVLTVAIMTRYLGKIGFGEYSTITAYLQIFGILIDMGLSLIIIRLLADTEFENQKVINNVFTLRFFSSLVFLGLAPLIIIFLPYPLLIKIGVAIADLSFFFSSLNKILISLFQKELKMLNVTVAEIGGRLVLFVFVFIFALYDFGLLAIILAVVLGSLTNFLMNYSSAKKFVKISFAFDWPVWHKILKFTWPVAISIAFNLVYFKADTIILSLVRSQSEVGLYSAPYRILEILTNFIYLFMGLLFPVLTFAWQQKNLDRFRGMIQKTLDILLIITIPMIFGTLFVAKRLMLLIAGPEFAESGLILQILIFATAFIFINSLFGYLIVVIDKQKKIVGAYVFVAIFSLLGYILTIPKYGYFGAAAFTIISEALIFIFNFIIVTKTIKFMPSFSILYKAIAASLIMSLFLYVSRNLNVIGLFFLSSLIYLLALYLFKGLPKELILEMLKIKSEPEVAKINE
ncbi:MAG: flippase [Candidatus Parcubacteria bacterium]|nr:flippase [Candidatus Parcubacteria bacterium]